MCVRPKNHQQPLLQRLPMATISVLKGGVGDDLSNQRSQVESYQLKAKDLHLAESDFMYAAV
jgi:hypothetical protein